MNTNKINEIKVNDAVQSLLCTGIKGSKVMSKSLEFAITLSLVLGLSVSAPSKALAETGGTDGGGGHRVEDQFFDNWLRGKLMDPMKHRAYLNTVAPLIERIKDQVPKFGRELEEVLTQKDWYTAKQKKPHLSAKRAGIVFDAKEAAFQTEQEVYLDGNWFNNAKPEDQATAILHEAIQGVRIKRGKDDRGEYVVPAESVWRMTVRLMSGKYGTEDSLVKGLYDLEFKIPYTGDDYKTKTELLKEAEEERQAAELARQEKEKQDEIARLEKEKNDAEDLIVAQFIEDYRQRFIDICTRLPWEEMGWGASRTAMRSIYLEMLNRSGAMRPDFRVEHGFDNLSVGISIEVREKLLKAFIKLIGQKFEIARADEGEGFSFRIDTEIGKLFGEYDFEYENERKKICFRLGVEPRSASVSSQNVKRFAEPKSAVASESSGKSVGRALATDRK